MGLDEIALLILLGTFTSSFNQLMGCWLKAGLGWPWLHSWGVLAHFMCLFSSRPVRNVHMEMETVQTNRQKHAGFLKTWAWNWHTITSTSFYWPKQWDIYIYIFH